MRKPRHSRQASKLAGDIKSFFEQYFGVTLYDWQTKQVVNMMKGSEPSNFAKWGSAKLSKSGAAVNFTPSKEMKAKGQLFHTMPVSLLKQLLDKKLQFISVSVSAKDLEPTKSAE